MLYEFMMFRAYHWDYVIVSYMKWLQSIWKMLVDIMFHVCTHLRKFHENTTKRVNQLIQ